VTTDTTIPETPRPERPVRFLHGSRPNGSHVWMPFRTRAEFRTHRERTVPFAPDDTTWDITTTDQPAAPERAEEEPVS